MSATVRQAGIRLSLQGAQEVTRGLREIGDAGERNLQRVTQEAGTAARALQLLGPLLGGLGAGLGIGSALGLAQSVLTDIGNRIVAMGRDVLGVGEAAETARRAADEWMASLRDEDNRTRNTLREVNDLLLTSAERAAQAQNVLRQGLRDQVEADLATRLARQGDVPVQLQGLDAQIAAARRTVATEEAIARSAVNSALGSPTDGTSSARALLDRLQAERNNLVRQLEVDQRNITQLEESRRRLAGSYGVEEFGPPAPPRAAGGGRGEVDTTGRDLARDLAQRRQEVERITQAYDAYNRQINLQNAGLDRAGPVLDAYAREMQNLDSFLREGLITQEFFEERVRLASEALGEQMEQAQRAGQAVSDLSRQTSRFAATAAGDFLKAAIAGKNLADTLSNILSRLGDLFLNSAFQSIFGGGKGGGFDLFGWLGGAIFGGGGEALAGKRAMGGPVEAGRPYLVGERGPEIFVPRQSGGIVPNGQGAAPTIVNNYDFRGATVDEVKFRRIADESARRAVAGLVEGRRESRSVLA
ncbi:hypothetical protein [Roseococcus microcysteis]|uniref:hypothetical protein n=1 Tax=Roseococcus microcysteis TaxID=2771361 RepID=UPI00168BA0D2|nr:hypothetical protein [Roseococcus microcysteis]